MANVDGPENPLKTSRNPNDRAESLGCGIALHVAGGIMVAGQLGWIQNAD
jgi:hypothetical protein